MRLVDADGIQYDQLLNTGNKEHPLEWAVSRSRIDNMPTIEVVRCKDCIHRMEDGMCEYKDHRVFVQDDNDFCSWGDKKDETEPGIYKTDMEEQL